MTSTPHPRPWIQEATILGFCLAFCGLCLVLVCCRLWHCLLPFARRAARATILVFCTPRPIDGWLFTFCNPAHE